MPLINTLKILKDAKREHRAIAAINVGNLENLVALIEAAEEEKAPLIIQIYQRLLADKAMRGLAAAAIKMAQDSTADLAFHLDHGASLDQIRIAIDMGFSSVMFDGSKLPFAENVGLSAQAVGLAHGAGIGIEGEIGQILSASDDIPYCDPGEAVRFAQESGVDSLAAAVGSAHGFYKKEPALSFDIMDRINSAVDIPLVLHGGTGIPDAQIKESMRHGVAKVNIATEFQNLFLEETKAQLSQLKAFKPVDIFFKPVVASLKDFVKGRIRLLRG